MSDAKQPVKPLRIAIAGLGAIGKSIAITLSQGRVPGVVLTAVSAKNLERAQSFVNTLAHPVKVLPIAELEKEADLLIECAPAALLPEIAGPFLNAQKQVIVLSVGALLFHPELLERAKKEGAIIHVPTGALIGLDAMIAAAEGKIHSVRMMTRKPPAGLAGAPHLLANNICIDGLTEPKLVFSGNARDAAKGFPANLNTVVALALAGIGPEHTLLEIWADPNVVRNSHSITVESDAAQFTMTMENIPSENPKTSRIVAQSVIAMLRKMQSNFRIGT